VTRATPLIAIDGAAGSGKSTLARRLASELGVPYVNTGLMYRAVTARALAEGVDPSDGDAVALLADRVRFDLDATVSPPALVIGGAPPSEDLLRQDVEAAVSAVSRHPSLRSRMAEIQRRLGRRGVVMEGRDIGSVVFPDADVKIFLDAAARERVRRRARERSGVAADAESLIERDRRDSEVNPFVPAPGAIRIDTTGKDQDEVYREALAIVRTAIGAQRS
jgi:cytidylate kinase